MKTRLTFVSAVLALLSTLVVTLTYQPLIQSLVMAVREFDPTSQALLRVTKLLPLLFFGDVVVIGGLLFTALYVYIAAPLSRTEAAIRHIAEQVDVAPSLTQPIAPLLNHALSNLRGALETERERNRAQLADLKRTNESLARLQAELVAADRLATVGKLAAGVAHEVGNPLAGILGYMSVIRMKGTKLVPDVAPRAELTDLVDRVEAEVQRIDAIVRSLLELGRPSRGKAQPIDVRSVIDSAVRLMSASEFAHVKVVIEGPESLWLRGEAGPLSQVLINLLINAAQLMTSGTITVRARVEGGKGLISVEDQGPGLSDEVKARLFEPFFTTKAPGQGTGLGLAMSRHLLSQFEGELWAENGQGGGAVFTVVLPVP